MNIHAREGHKIKYTHPTAGYLGDQETARKHLILNHQYSVKKTVVHDYTTDVYLREIEQEGVFFNSVMFDDV
jgi:hypothetical protein